MRAWLCVVAMGCGRVSFDALPASLDDAAPMDGGDFVSNCAVMLHMDEPSWNGTLDEVLDGCGGRNGTALNGATTVDDAVRGRVGLFSDPACVEIADDLALRANQALTISAWIFPTALDATSPFGIVSKRVDYLVNDAYSVFAYTDNKVWVNIDTNNDTFGSIGTLANDQWRQITVVFDGSLPAASRVSVYLDGVLDGPARESSVSVSPFASPLYIGCLPDPPSLQQSFVGRLDDVAVWTRAFDAANVRSWYDATKR